MRIELQRLKSVFSADSALSGRLSSGLQTIGLPRDTDSLVTVMFGEATAHKGYTVEID